MLHMRNWRRRTRSQATRRSTDLLASPPRARLSPASLLERDRSRYLALRSLLPAMAWASQASARPVAEPALVARVQTSVFTESQMGAARREREVGRLAYGATPGVRPALATMGYWAPPMQTRPVGFITTELIQRWLRRTTRRVART